MGSKVPVKNTFGNLGNSEEEEDEEIETTPPPPGLPRVVQRNTRNRPKKVRMCNTVGICEFDCDNCDLCPVESKEIKMDLKFEVAGVKKPLIAVKRICEKGNVVSFGPLEKDNFIQNKDTGDKVLLRKSGKGSYLMDVHFDNGSSTSITVDSGAEENVCPYEWGTVFGIRDPERWKNFCGANGSRIEHFGTRNVRVVSSTF